MDSNMMMLKGWLLCLARSVERKAKFFSDSDLASVCETAASERELFEFASFLQAGCEFLVSSGNAAFIKPALKDGRFKGEASLFEMFRKYEVWQKFAQQVLSTCADAKVPLTRHGLPAEIISLRCLPESLVTMKPEETGPFIAEYSARGFLASKGFGPGDDYSALDVIGEMGVYEFKDEPAPVRAYLGYLIRAGLEKDLSSAFGRKRKDTDGFIGSNDSHFTTSSFRTFEPGPNAILHFAGADGLPYWSILDIVDGSACEVRMFPVYSDGAPPILLAQNALQHHLSR